MSESNLSAALAVLEKIALARPDAEVDAALGTVRVSQRSANGVELFESFQGHVNAIRRIISGHALTERGLNLLIETAHDLSSTLTVQDLLQTVVTRARSLVAPISPG